MRRLPLALVVGLVLVVSCASPKIPPLDITSDTWTGNIGYINVSVEFYADGTYKLISTGGEDITGSKYTLTEKQSKESEEIGTYTLTSNPDGSYGLEMKYRKEVKDKEGNVVKYADDYIGNISFKNGQWNAIGSETMYDLPSIGSKFSPSTVKFDFEWTHAE
jgi:hypothetical protein